MLARGHVVEAGLLRPLRFGDDAIRIAEHEAYLHEGWGREGRDMNSIERYNHN